MTAAEQFGNPSYVDPGITLFVVLMVVAVVLAVACVYYGLPSAQGEAGAEDD